MFEPTFYFFASYLSPLLTAYMPYRFLFFSDSNSHIIRLNLGLRNLTHSPLKDWLSSLLSLLSSPFLSVWVCVWLFFSKSEEVCAYYLQIWLHSGLCWWFLLESYLLNYLISLC